MSPYTAIVRRSGNPFELAHVAVSWLAGAGYDAYVVVGCADRDTCMAIRYRTVCPETPDESEVMFAQFLFFLLFFILTATPITMIRGNKESHQDLLDPSYPRLYDDDPCRIKN